MIKIKDLIGQKYNRLTVVGFDRYDKEKRLYFWKCECECGTIKTVQSGALKTGNTKSCGCLNRELAAKRAKKKFTTHGLKKHPIYRTRTKMIYRCYNENYERFDCYGGRGIKVCDEWLDKENGFLKFYNWAINNGWRKGLTIERINVNGNYSPENCTWIPQSEQPKNRRNTKKVSGQ